MMTEAQLEREIENRVKNAIRTCQRDTLSAWDQRHIPNTTRRMMQTIKTYVRQQIALTRE